MEKYNVLIDWKGDAENAADAIKKAANAPATVRIGDITWEDIDGFANTLFPDRAVLVFSDMQDAFIGLTQDGRAVYDYEKMIDCKVARDGMTVAEAAEFLEFNTIGSLKHCENAPLVLFRYL